MIECKDFFELLSRRDINFYTGVPDSTLKDFCAYVTDNVDKEHHIITANEGGAIALASGYHLSTGKTALVYMQNSGLGNALNPLVSLADPEVYNIPILLLIGWRGEPGKKDEPQHIKQGRITLPLLSTLEIPCEILGDNLKEAEEIVNKAVSILKTGKSFALVVRKGIFNKYQLKKGEKDSFNIEREQAIKLIAEKLGKNDFIVSTTGKISRELYEYRDEANDGHENDFLTVGSMGHCSHIALGIALAMTDKNIYCFDGDGSFIMHMGSLAINGATSAKNFKHIVFNNAAHDSVGGQPTVAGKIDIPGIAVACGYKSTYKATTLSELLQVIDDFILKDGPSLLEICVKKGARDNLGRPKHKPSQIKNLFMNNIKK